MHQNWYVVVSGEKKGPLSDTEVATLIKVGTVDARSLVWSSHAASDEWLPLYRTDLKSFLPNDSILPPELPQQVKNGGTAQPLVTTSARDEGRPQREVYSQQVLTNWDSGSNISPPPQSTSDLKRQRPFIYNLLLVLTGIIGVLSFVSLRNHMDGSDDVQLWFERYMSLAQNEVFQLSYGLVGLSWLIVFFVWIRNETKVLFSLYGPQTISPAGSIYWFFVPIFNIWKPIQAMNNIANGRQIDSKKNVDKTILAWWITALLSIISYAISVSILQSGSQITWQNAEIGLRLDLVGNFLDLLNVAFLYYIVSTVSKSPFRK